MSILSVDLLYKLCCVFFICVLLYLALRRKFSYWEKKGLFYVTPNIPFGNTKDAFLGKQHLGLIFGKLYNENKHLKYFGAFMMLKPTLVINDLDVIKNILTKDFVHFSDHGFEFNEEVEPLGGHLFNSRGEKWKNLRIKLTPTFTSSKMRSMFDIVAACSVVMSQYLEEHIAKNEVEDMKGIMACFGNDVIANCAFGIECNSFKDPNNAFRKMAKMFFKPNMFRQIIGSIEFFLPGVLSQFGFKIISEDVDKFFCGIVEDTVKYREENNIVRNDFMHLLIQLKNHGSITNEENNEAIPDDGTRLTVKQMAAQAFIFFIAGFETSSSASSFALYELALNPDIQTKASEEIDEVLAKHNGKVTYESLGEMVYLTKVVEETMRKYPALPAMFRVCTKDYIMPESNIKIEKGTSVIIPIYGIQRDEEFFPNPDKFDPERFSPENKATRNNFSYLPFGEGPRICIGSRFGMVQVKLGLVTILSKYEVSVCEKTTIPMKYDNKSFVLTADDGVWLRLKKRTK